MVMTPSSMMPLGTSAPYFELQDTVSEKKVSLADLKSETATVIMFICNHCPYVIYVLSGLVKLANDYKPKDVSFIAINANDIENYPEDSPEKMRELARGLGDPFPYLFDETQSVARSYGAACTPDFFIFDNALKCAYRGQLDDSRPGNATPVTGSDIRDALNNILSQKPVNPDQKPSIGCNIKWK